MLWRYSGSKRSVLKHLPPLPAVPDKVIEPFAGGAAFSMALRPKKVVLAEANSDVLGLWEWLATSATKEDLILLEHRKPTEKIDIRTLNLPKPQETLMRLTISGVYTGQLSSVIAYPQHKMDFTELRHALAYLQSAVQVPLFDDFRDTADLEGFFFIDPPYFGTKGNYIDKSRKKDRTFGFTPKDVGDFVAGLKQPYIFTYGDGAPELFPQFEWKKAMTKKVPLIRTGGTKERTEWYCSQI